MNLTRTLKRPFCQWSETEEGNWISDCGEVFCMIEGTPAENKYSFCPSCGRILREKGINLEAAP